MSTRRRFSTEFKAKVALEALRGDKTIQEIAARHKVHPNQVSVWKQRAAAGMTVVTCKRNLAVVVEIAVSHMSRSQLSR